MRHFILVVSASLLALPLFGQEKSPQLKDWKDQYSYSIGMQLGSTLREKKEDLNPDILAAGFKDAITLSDDQVKDVRARLKKDMIRPGNTKMIDESVPAAEATVWTMLFS